ncbi:nickel pincer cofactor biosynthesis protein LarC [Methanocaldococcus sp.]|uniref:nickel pincer cofactor biosynthesis protein LarC n=1 Tax=Methanocaldococcus sp. TaxID=2152917 RepID=UPI002605DF74|nr:nickel pincer cofactor biosynthesis protein LarC [Methanocaldococcus sp.]MCQ6253477.1 nickel pincer cofactor biosynthesis protein LarC [Methanocaldococcus sp.]
MYILDPFSGISGDMFLSAMITFVNKEELIETIKKVVDVDIEIKKVKKCHIIANKVNIIPKDKEYKMNSYKDIVKVIKEANISKDIKNISLDILKILSEAESRVHNVKIDDVHFHEIGNYDTVADIVGASYIINKLNLKDNCFYRPINVGNGFVKTEHGLFPVPAPATSEILKGMKIFFSDINEELTTPTGAAIIKYLNPKLIEDSFIVKEISYGAGYKDLKIPNVLRVFKIEDKVLEKIVLLETNVDDVSPEILGYLYEVLEGKVKDLHFIPTYMKKNRPSYTIRAIVKKDLVNDVSKIIMRETGTLGIRIYKINRIIANREFKTVKVFDDDVRIKIGKIDDEIISEKPEYEDLKKIAKKYNIPLKDLYKLILKDL